MLKKDFCFPFLMTLKRLATVAGSDTCNLKPYLSGVEYLMKIWRRVAQQ